MTKPVHFLAGLVIGTIESVSPNSLTVLLNVDAPQTTALNTGTPTNFPRISSYVLIPGQAGAVVGQIAWVGVEPSPFPKRPGLKDFGLIDLPYPVRKMRVTPVGTLTALSASSDQSIEFRFERGVTAFPSVGDAVVLATMYQLRAIIESSGKDQRVVIGRAPLSHNATISVDPDKLFGRHTAVIGNTGSGKSCTVAGLIRWSLEAALKESLKERGRREINARFIVLDPNGEYTSVFQDLTESVRVFRVVLDGLRENSEGVSLLSLPAWMWNAEEWFAFTAAAPGVQQPMLMRALHELRCGATTQKPPEWRACQLAAQYQALLRTKINSGPSAFAAFPGRLDCHQILARLADDLESRADDCSDTAMCEVLRSAAEHVKGIRSKQSTVKSGKTYEDAFSVGDLESVVESLDEIVVMSPAEVAGSSSIDPDSPVRFVVGDLPDHLEFVAGQEPSGSTSQYVGYLSVRIRILLSDARIQSIVNPEEGVSLAEWLSTYISDGHSNSGGVSVIDLSLVPSGVLHIIVSAIGRLVFEAVQRHRKHFGKELPTVIVLEEAHSFIQKGADDPNELPTPAQLCRRTFERIAREGRKFGVGLVLSSQRPSEISETVLAQCNTFILHRLVNDRDQAYVSRLVPDLHADLLKELPSLPSQHAILLGWASPIPKLVRINDLSEAHRPRSDDPRFWEVWTGKEERVVDWEAIAAEWTGLRETYRGGDEVEGSAEA